jgi:hypothetical protein
MFDLASYEQQVRAAGKPVTFEVADEAVMHIYGNRWREFTAAIEQAIREAPAHGLQMTCTRDDRRCCEVFTITEATGDGGGEVTNE